MGFFFENNYGSQTILLDSQGFETILVSNKSSTENSILLREIVLGTRVSKLHLELECETLEFQVQFLRAKSSSLHSIWNSSVSKCNFSEQN